MLDIAKAFPIHLPTLPRVIFTALAIEATLSPDWLRLRIRARCTSRQGAVCESRNCKSCSRSSAVRASRERLDLPATAKVYHGTFSLEHVLLKRYTSHRWCSRQGRRLQPNRTRAGEDRQRECRILAAHHHRGRRRLRGDPGVGRWMADGPKAGAFVRNRARALGEKMRAEKGVVDAGNHRAHRGKLMHRTCAISTGRERVYVRPLRPGTCTR
jgi:hypothetical protein